MKYIALDKLFRLIKPYYMGKTDTKVRLFKKIAVYQIKNEAV